MKIFDKPSVFMCVVGVIVTLPLRIGLISARFCRSSRSSFIFIWASTRCCNDAAKPNQKQTHILTKQIVNLFHHSNLPSKGAPLFR